MGLFNDNYDTGKNASTDKFLSALKKLKSYAPDTRDKNKVLLDGAAQAFREGRPQNVQTAIANVKALDSRYCPNLVPVVLFEISKNSGDKLSAINRALANVPEDGRQDVLNHALNDAIGNKIGDESFFAALLEAGADAKADVNGPSGLLATAISGAAPLSFIKLLHDSGADFDHALGTLHSRGSKTEDIDRLEHYRKKTTAGIGMEEAMIAVLTTLQQIQNQIRELTARIDRLSPPEPAANTNLPKDVKDRPKSPVRKFPPLT
jgi:hypothetical protein